VLSCLPAIIAVAQESRRYIEGSPPYAPGLDEAAAKPLPMQHEQHGFMQEASPRGREVRHCGIESGVCGAYPLRSAWPDDLRAHLTTHMKMASAGGSCLGSPGDCWLLAVSAEAR